MINSKNADSLAWIIIWVFILSFALVWIISILSYNKNVIQIYEENIYNNIINENWDNIIKKLNTDNTIYKDDFYVYKDNINKNFLIYTWTENEKYKYIDKLWNLINTNENVWKTYKRSFNNQTDVLRHEIIPTEIPNLVLHFDAQNIDWTNNSSITELDRIDTWLDLSWNNNNWIQNNPTNKPIYKSIWIGFKPYLKFDWNKTLEIENSWLLNDDWDSYTDIIFDKKTIAIVFKTWFETNNFQNIYEQWDSNKWYAIQIENNNLYAWVWNNSWDSWNQYKYLDIWEIIPNTNYFIVLTQDSTSANDNENKLKIYLNWYFINEIDHVDPQTEHDWVIWLGAVFHGSYGLLNNTPITTSNYINYFEWGWIWEFIIWNNCLTKNDVRWLNNYFNEKWLNLNEHIIYNIITNTTTKYNEN